MAVVGRKRQKYTTYYVVNEWQGEPLWTKVGRDKREAERVDRDQKRRIADGTFLPEGQSASISVEQYAKEWLSKRTNRTAKEDRRWLENYVFRVEWFSDMAIADVRPRHIGQLVSELKAMPKKQKPSECLTGKSVANIYGAVKTLFRDARIAELTNEDPCVVPRGAISRKVTRKREPYLVSEALRLMDPAMPGDMRMFNALALLTGMRQGEICGRRWSDWDRFATPLTGLYVTTQYDDQPLKTNDERSDHPRAVPVHPELQKLLEWWWESGFEFVYCRKPLETDFIVPKRDGNPHARWSSRDMFVNSCEVAGVPNRTLHSTRHTFITWARRSGREDLVQQITHNAQGKVLDMYTHWEWDPLCAVVSCVFLDVKLDAGRINRGLYVGRPGLEPNRKKRKHRKTRESDDEGGSDERSNFPKKSKRDADSAARQETSTLPGVYGELAQGLVRLKLEADLFERFYLDNAGDE